MNPTYPDITVTLTGQDGNAYHVLGLVLRAMRQAGLSQEARDAFRQEATAGNYDHLLQVVMHTVTVE